MFTTLKRFFDFCNEEDRKKLYLAIGLGVIRAIFAALRISAIGAVVMGILDGNMTSKNIWIAVAILAVIVYMLFIKKYTESSKLTEKAVTQGS